MPNGTDLIIDDALWYKDAIVYELHIKAFFDGDDDGVGDLKGLTQKLDYLKDLGITAVWLLPFYPSPLRDDGYDIADFFGIHPYYGTLRDFRELLRQAHKRGIRVITELVLNHTSDQHPWFQRARRAKPGSHFRNFYVWSDDPNKYSDARIIFQDFENSNWTWDPVANAYYWHRFYSHQPDLNYENPLVQKEMFRVIDYWMRMGVDGMRLDAVPYLFEDEGTNCENLPATYEFLRKLRDHVNTNFRNRMLLAEANQWPEDAVAYFGNGDMCNMAFHFPLMPRLFMALEMEDNFPIIDIMDQTPAIPENCQWALFLRNHDELTLEMVTDEERDYMYRMYVTDPRARINLGIRRRLAPLLRNDFRKMRLLKGLLFCLPGTPVLYYGDEIGMGDNYYLGDRDGVRTPMQWSPDKNGGFSRADPQMLYLPPIIDYSYHYQTINVENMERNSSSFLWFMRRLIALRKRYQAFGRGSMRVIKSSNNKIFSFIREYGDERILIAANLSRLPQMTTLNLSEFAGMVPEELLSRNHFHQITDSPYILTFAPHGGFLFLLGRGSGPSCIPLSGVDGLSTAGHWSEIFEGRGREIMEDSVLPSYISGCRWFGGKARQVQQLRISEIVPVTRDTSDARIVLMNVEYVTGLPDMYMMALGFATGEEAVRIKENFAWSVVSPMKVGGVEGILYDSLSNEEFCKELLWMIAKHRRLKTSLGELIATPGNGFRNEILNIAQNLKPSILKADQSNTSVLFGEEYFLKLYRHPDEGINPDLEISRFLTQRAQFPYTPPFAGGLELKRRNGKVVTLGILLKFVQNQGNALDYFLSGLHRFYEEILSTKQEIPEKSHAGVPLIDLAMQKVPPEIIPGNIGTGVPIEMVELLGVRTAQMHIALSSDTADPAFAPERFSTLWQRSIFQSMQSLLKRNFQLLSSNIAGLSPETAAEAADLLGRGEQIIATYRSVLKKKIAAKRIRVHGDYHLGQVLYTGKDYVIIDFEGEPARTLGERRLKVSALRDAAGMMRSFHYAAYMALRDSNLPDTDIPKLEPWAELWYRSVSVVFLRAYLDAMGDTGLIPNDQEELKTLLTCFLLDKAVYEMGYELNNRPDWLHIPVRGIRYLLELTE